MPQDDKRGYKKEILLADERNRDMAAVIKYGPYLYLSSSDGNRDLKTEQIDPSLDWQAVPQCHNSYGRQALRLEKAGYRGDDAIWIENYTSGQHWRLERMATMKKLPAMVSPSSLSVAPAATMRFPNPRM